MNPVDYLSPEWVFLGSCIELDGEDCINNMKHSPTSVSYTTLRRVVGAKIVDEVVSALGYATGKQRGGMRISKDWAVGFYQSTYGTVPCYYIAWSGIEHVFVPRDQASAALECGK